MLAWTLLLLPALCSGGWLLHPCDCDSTTGCEHEADCASDPCEIGVARSDSWSQSDGDLDATALRSPAAVDDPSYRPQSASRRFAPLPSPLAFAKALPFPPADLPLLI